MAYKNKEDQLKCQRDWYNKNKELVLDRQKVRRKKLRSWFNELKSTLKCELCGEEHPATLDFHHKNPKDKEMLISIMIQNTWSMENILKEMNKCMVVCSNCHRKIHYNN